MRFGSKTGGQMTITDFDRIQSVKSVVSATEFKAKCLAFLDEMEQHGGAVIITRRGRPVAVLGPVRKNCLKSPRGMWSGKLHIKDDLATLDTSGLWDVTRK